MLRTVPDSTHPTTCAIHMLTPLSRREHATPGATGRMPETSIPAGCRGYVGWRRDALKARQLVGCHAEFRFFDRAFLPRVDF
jgi:hypothetical protein